MSMIIKAMNMPKSCHDCAMRYMSIGLDFECVFTNDYVGDCVERRLANCPIVEVPTPHGRLIDADVIMDLLEKSVPEKNRGHQFYVFRHMLRNAPTIIEADQGDG